MGGLGGRRRIRYLPPSFITRESLGRFSTTTIAHGTPQDALRAVYAETQAFKIHYDGGSFSINGKQARTHVPTLVALVRDHGFREADARFLMKRAEAKQVYRCRVKYANPYLTEQGPSAPVIPEPEYSDYNPMGARTPTQSMQEQLLSVPQLDSSLTDRTIYNPSPDYTPDPMDTQKIDSAMRSGQRELFDTAMIGQMLRTVNDDAMIDQYLPELIKGMDRLGRILFQFYWHGDAFAERYGKADMPELEDSLRNVFDGTGDVVQFLQQKSIQPYPEEVAHSTDLADVANA